MMGIPNCKVSIIIPSYKNTSTLKKAVDSALKQSYQNIEVIVVNDNDFNDKYYLDTMRIVESYEDSRVIHIANGKNSERSFSRNNGVAHSSGEYIMFLDNDDEFLPRKVESQLICLQGHDDSYAVCYSNYVRKRNGKIVCYCGESREGNLQFDTLCRNLFIHPGSNLMIRRSVFDEVGGFNNNMNINEDIDLLLRIQNKYKICFCKELGLIVNIHGHPNLNYVSKSEFYINTEQAFYEKLNDAEKKKFMCFMGIQMIKCLGLKDISLSLNIKKKYDVSCLVLFRYFFYLAKRYISKKAFSFNM